MVDTVFDTFDQSMQIGVIGGINSEGKRIDKKANVSLDLCCRASRNGRADYDITLIGYLPKQGAVKCDEYGEQCGLMLIGQTLKAFSRLNTDFER